MLSEIPFSLKDSLAFETWPGYPCTWSAPSGTEPRPVAQSMGKQNLGGAVLLGQSVGQCDTLTHEDFSLSVEVVSNEPKPVEDQGGQLGVGVLVAPLHHVHDVVVGAALVTKDWP